MLCSTSPYFCPFITNLLPDFLALVFMESVSEPLEGSVTPKACNLIFPFAISGKYFCFNSSLHALSDPIIYI